MKRAMKFIPGVFTFLSIFLIPLFFTGCSQTIEGVPYKCVRGCSDFCDFSQAEIYVDNNTIFLNWFDGWLSGDLQPDKTFIIRSNLATCDGSELQDGKLELYCSYTDECHGTCDHPSVLGICQAAYYGKEMERTNE